MTVEGALSRHSVGPGAREEDVVGHLSVVGSTITVALNYRGHEER